MAVWNDLLDDVMPEIQGSPPIALVTHHIKNAVIRFLDRTRVLRKTTSPVDWAGGVGPRPLTNAVFGAELITPSERVIEVRSVAWLGRQLPALREGDLEFEHGSDWATKTGTPTHYSETTGGLLLVPSPPLTANALILAISYSLLPTATSFPDSVLHDYREALAFGAKASLFYMAGKPWSDPIAADINYRQFDVRMAAASVKAMRQTARGVLGVKPFPF